jgi:hypothetical protein
MNAPEWAGSAAAYLAVGLLAALVLRRQGHALPTAVCSIGLWPLLLPLLSRPPARSSGPYQAQIGQAFDAADGLLVRTGTPLRAELAALRCSVESADARLGLVDQILADGTRAGPLAQARERAGQELERVISGVGEIRQALGWLALSGMHGGGDPSIHHRMADLKSRLQTLQEVAELQDLSVVGRAKAHSNPGRVP